ncbi:hypothetical protein [Nocardia sp. NRRL S-836]|uniref:hypothetical protein n=1 Tax=Nocardia sp. NRRL S-836 TaxID=1519492 RepID=UPI0006AF5A57|nr:hypothetical protein [Nocardia sp. NRRL S-836]KOV87186.1 hypothetical protein ADL03_07415 [Nocardia sp. NRRL S-836]
MTTPTRTLGEAERAVNELAGRIRRHWSTTKDRRVQAACSAVELVYHFVERCLRKEEVAEPISTAVRADEAFAGRFAAIHATVKDFGACLMAIDRAGASPSRDKLVDDLTALSIRLRQQLSDAVDAFVAVVDAVRADPADQANAQRVATDLRQQLKTRELLQEAEDARDELRKVTGDVGAGELGTHYAGYADVEAKRADQLRWGVAGLLGLVAAGAVALSLWHPELSYSTALVRLSATVPIGVLAAYLARESGKHRQNAKNARDLAIAMHTLPSYVEPLPENGAELRMALGKRVFGPSADQAGPEPPQDDGLVNDLPRALDALEEVLHRIKQAVERRP